jgi:hypothetical protein
MTGLTNLGGYKLRWPTNLILHTRLSVRGFKDSSDCRGAIEFASSTTRMLCDSAVDGVAAARLIMHLGGSSCAKLH